MTINRAGRIAPLLAFLLFADLSIDPILASIVCTQNYFLVGHELPLQRSAGRLLVLDDCSFEVQELRWHGEDSEVCSWWAGIGLSQDSDNSSREDRLQELELEHYGASGEKERAVLPEGITWDAVNTLQLRCPLQPGAKAWAEVPHGPEHGEGSAAQRRLLQSGGAPALLSTYPGQGQDSASASPSEGSGDGLPQPLFPPPPGPPRTSADASQQRLTFSPNAEAAAFSAVDVSGGPSVTVVDNSPGLPSLGAYPGAATDLTLTTPPAFPDFSPSPEAAAASSPQLGQGTAAYAAAASPPLATPAATVPAAAPQAVNAAVPATVPVASPPAQAAASPPVAAVTPPVAAVAAVPPTQATPVPTPLPTPAATTAAASVSPAAAPAETIRTESPVGSPVQPPVQAMVPPAVVPASPTPAAAAPSPVPSDAEDVAAALAQLPPGALAPAIGQNLSALAAAAGQDLNNVGGQNLTALGGANVGDLAGSVLGGGNALAPAPTPTATQLINSVVPPSAVLPVPGQTPAGEVSAPAPPPAVAASPGQAPAADLSDAAAAAAALEALTNQANAPAQSTDAALAAALAAAAMPPAAVSQSAAAPRPSAPVAAPNTAAAAVPPTAAAPGPSGFVSATPAAPVPAPAAASQSTSAASQDLGSEAASAPPQAQADYNAALAEALAAASPPPPAGAPVSGPGDYDAALAAALAAANEAPPAAVPAPIAPAPVPAAAAPVLSTADAAAAAAAALVAAGLAPPADQQALLAAIAGILVRAPAPAPSPATAPEASRTVPSSVALAPSFYDNVAGGGGPTASPVLAPALAPGSSGMMPSSLALAPSIYSSVAGSGGQTASASPAATPAPAPGSSSTDAAPAAAPIAAAPSSSPGAPPSDADLASAAIAALYAPPPVAIPQLAPVPAPSAAFPPIPAAAPAPAPARDFRVASSSLPAAPAAAPAQQPLPYAPPPLGNVTLTFQPPAAPAEDLGGYPGDSNAPPAMQILAPAPLAAAGPAEALVAPAPAPGLDIPEVLGGGARRPTRPGALAASPGPAPQLAPAPGATFAGVPTPALASSGAPAAAPEPAAAGPAPAAAPGQSLSLGPVAAPILAPAPALAAPSEGPAMAPGLAAAPGAAPASSLMMAPAPGPAGQPVVNLALTLNGLADLSPAGKAAIQQALAKQLNLAPEQITVLGARPAGSIPTRRRMMLQQLPQTNQSSVVDVQIRPAPDQAEGVLAAISQSTFPAAIKDQLASAGLPVQSAGVAAVSQSFAPPPASTPQPTPAPMEKSAADTALQAWNDKMIKIHGWLMFSAFIIFLPFAIVTAFAFKDWQPFWFYIHISAVVLALVAAAAGLVVGFALIIDDFKQVIHKWAGLAIVAGLLLQVLSAFLVRPPPDSRFRKYWNTAHFWWGRILAVVALLNFFFGLFLVHSSPLYYIVPAAILLAWLLIGLVKKLFSSMRTGSGQHRENKATAESLRMDYHMRGSGNGSRKPIQELYSSPLPGNNGASLHTRPSYLGGGNAAYGNPHSAGSGIQMSSAVGNGYGIAGAPAAVERGAPGGGPGVPKSAFAAAGQNGGDWDDDEGEPVRNGGGTSSSNLPRPPLHPLPSHGSFTAQLPPRPTELLKEGKVGAGEQIIARRRNRRLVPEGVPLNSRLSGALSGNLDASIGKRAAEAYKPRPRPSKLLSTPPEEMFGDEDEDYSPPPLRQRPAAAAVRSNISNGVGHDNGAEVSPPDSNRSADENDLPPAVKARINSYYK